MPDLATLCAATAHCPRAMSPAIEVPETMTMEGRIQPEQNAGILSRRHIRSGSNSRPILPARRADSDIIHKICGDEMAQAGEESFLAVILTGLTEKAHAPLR